MSRNLHIFLLFLFIAVEGHKIVYNDVVEKTVAILQTCIRSNANNVLLLAGECDEFLIPSVITNSSVALIDASKRSAFDAFTLTRYSYVLYQRYYFLHLLQKLNRFVVIASSQPALRLLLQRIKDSTWSNFEGFHILIDRRTEDRGCINAYKFLRAAWEYDLVSSIFVCIDPDEGLLIFTYDPYSNKAPDVWKVADTFKGRQGHPWVLLKRKYRDGLQMCEDLNFDKTFQLNGYQIRLNAISVTPFLEIDLNKEGLAKFTGDNSEIIKILFNKLNASVDVTIHNDTVLELGGIGTHGNMVGILADVSNGKVDMSMNARSLYAMWKIRYTYPHAQGGLCVITQPVGNLSVFQKIMSFMSLGVTIRVIILSLIALLVLTKHNGFFPALLNVIRLSTAVSMVRLPTLASSRIFLSSIMLMFLIINTIFQSHWSSLLTVPVSQPNIRNYGDLKKSGYTIYGPKILQHAIADKVFQSRFHGVPYDECKQQVLKSKRAACLGDCLHLIQRIRMEDLHRSPKIRQLIQVYVTRENWPPFGRVNTLIQRMVEAGLVVMWRRQNVRKLFWPKIRKRIKDRRSFRVLKMKNLMFSFYILSGGYVLGFVVFVGEVLLGHRHRVIGSV